MRAEVGKYAKHSYNLLLMLYSSSFVGTLNMTILCFRDVEHPKIAQFAPGIKNQILKEKKTTVTITNCTGDIAYN